MVERLCFLFVKSMLFREVSVTGRIFYERRTRWRLGVVVASFSQYFKHFTSSSKSGGSGEVYCESQRKSRDVDTIFYV